MVVAALNQLRLCRQSKDQTNWSVPIPERPGATESRDESEWEDGGLSPEQQRARSEVGPTTVKYSTVQHSTVQYSTRAQQQLHIRIQSITQYRGVLTVNSTTTSINGFVVVGQEKSVYLWSQTLLDRRFPRANDTPNPKITFGNIWTFF